MTGVTLREFFERLLNDHAAAHREHQAAHDREHLASQKAIDTAATLSKENKADANEWRQTMTDRERTFARAEAVDRMAAEADRRLAALERANAQTQGALGVARFVGIGGLTTGLAALVWVVTNGGRV